MAQGGPASHRVWGKNPKGASEPPTWSPNQSLPLMVSYACHRQSSTDMFPSAALMPPWAATVCDLVGNSFVMHLHVGPLLVSKRCHKVGVHSRALEAPAGAHADTLLERSSC
jgi:hypothetical protein